MSKAPSDWVIDVEEQDFQRLVLESPRPVVVDFWAEWCGPCRMLGPLLEKLVGERKGMIVLAKVNVDRAEQVAAHFGVQSIPLVLGFRDGQVVDGFVGVRPESDIRAFLDRIGPSEADRLVRQAEELEAKNAAEAEAVYRRALTREPAHEAARVGLARVLLAQKKDEEVAGLLESVGTEGPLGAEAQRLKGLLSLRGLGEAAGGSEADLRRRLQAEPDNAEVRYDLGCALAQQGRHEEALEMLLSAGERDAKLAAGKVREAMVQIFYAVGPSSPLADKYRSRLARLLY
jgi:putative thioredoxin